MLIGDDATAAESAAVRSAAHPASNTAQPIAVSVRSDVCRRKYRFEPISLPGFGRTVLLWASEH